MRILLVDDEPDIREVALLSLQLDPDLDVCAEATGRGALALLEAGDWWPHLVLLDVMMPGMDGLAALAAMRALAGARRLPVAFMTARTRDSTLQDFLAAGAVAVITKPFPPLTLAERVRDILAQVDQDSA